MTDHFDCEQLRKLPYKDFLLTSYWKNIVAQVRARDGHRCRICNGSKRLDVHHRTYQHHGEEHLHLDDLTTLCHVCHERHHFPPQPEEHKVIVKTIVKYRDVPVLAVGATNSWKHLDKAERRFYRRAAFRLHRKAKSLFKLGREKVLEMMKETASTPAPAIQQNPPRPRLNGSIIVGDLNSVEADMPPGDEIILTKEILNKCRANGSFTSATVKVFGLNPCALGHGWAKTLIGLSMPRTKLFEAMRGRHLYSPVTFKKRRTIESPHSENTPHQN